MLWRSTALSDTIGVSTLMRDVFSGWKYGETPNCGGYQQWREPSVMYHTDLDTVSDLLASTTVSHGNHYLKGYVANSRGSIAYLHGRDYRPSS